MQWHEARSLELRVADRQLLLPIVQITARQAKCLRDSQSGRGKQAEQRRERCRGQSALRRQSTRRREQGFDLGRRVDVRCQTAMGVAERGVLREGGVRIAFCKDASERPQHVDATSPGKRIGVPCLLLCPSESTTAAVIAPFVAARVGEPSERERQIAGSIQREAEATSLGEILPPPARAW